eukprot:322129-Prymnesium_polylepis.1
MAYVLWPMMRHKAVLKRYAALRCLWHEMHHADPSPVRAHGRATFLSEQHTATIMPNSEIPIARARPASLPMTPLTPAHRRGRTTDL